MKITWNGQQTEMPAGVTVAEALTRCGVDRTGVLAAMRGSHVAELGDKLDQDAELSPLTLQQEEGQRIYERSLRFVMLLAVRRVLPGQRVRIHHSVGKGVLVGLPGYHTSSATIRAIEREMKAIIADDLPFTRRTWTLEEAIKYFREDGQEDKVQLLSTRKYNYFNMYACGGMWEYFYGAMTPSTGYVAVFDILLHDPGFILLCPDADFPQEAAPYVEKPKHLEAFAQSQHWCDILGVNNVYDLFRLADAQKLRSFIRINETLHGHAIGDIAECIVTSGKRVVMVAGPSSSGKTTFAGRLVVHLAVLGRRAYRVSLDDYYIDRDLLDREPDGSLDLEKLDALDLPLIREQVAALLNGEEIIMPRFSFKTGRREEQGHPPLRLGDDEVVILEGIHALNPTLLEGIPEREIHRVYVSALTCLNLDDHNRIRTTDARLLRRIVRDHQFRGTAPEETLAMWPNVHRGEARWIFPYQELADSVFNTTLHYELPVLKHFAFERLRRVPQDAEGYLLSRRLIKMLSYVPDIDPEILDEVPPLSLLREFIGGCTIDA